MLSIDVSVQSEISVAIDQDILAPVVVEIAPDGAHRHTFAGLIQICQSGARCDIFEGAVATIAVERVRLAEAAVGEVEVWLPIAVEVGDRDRRPERCDVWLDAGDLGIEARAMVDKVNAGRGSLVTQREPRMRGVRRRAGRPPIQSHRQQDCAQEGHRHDCAAHAGARSVCGGLGHESSIASVHQRCEKLRFTTRVSYSRRYRWCSASVG